MIQSSNIGRVVKPLSLGEQGECYLSHRYQDDFYPAGQGIALIIAEEWSRQWGIKQIDLSLLWVEELAPSQRAKSLTLIEVKTCRQSMGPVLSVGDRLRWRKTLLFLQQRLQLPMTLQLAQVHLKIPPLGGKEGANFFVKYFRIF